MPSEPATKKRKLGPSPSFSSQPVQQSFADVLERLKEESGDSVGETTSVIWHMAAELKELRDGRCRRGL